MNILIVDDREDNRIILSRLLSSRGHRVMEARNGQQGLDLCNEFAPDVIVSDILMPVMNGFRFCHTARNHPRLWDVPFVIYSAAFTSNEDKQLAADLGASLFIEKPLDPEEFLQRIEALPSRTGARNGEADRRANRAMYLLAGRIERRLDNMLTEKESALNRAERTLSMLTSSLPGFLYRCRADEDWTMEYVSEGCKGLIGYAPEDLVGRRGTKYRELMTGDEFEHVSEIIRQAVERKSPYSLDYRLITAGGDKILVSDHGSVVDEVGGIPLLEGYIRDLTPEHRRWQELEQFFRRAPALFLIAGLDSRIRQASQNCIQTLGWTAEELGGRCCFDLVHADDRDAMRAAFDRLDAGREVSGLRNRVRCKNDDYREFDWNAGTDGEMVFAVAREVA